MSFDKGFNSTDVGFLPLMLLLSDAGCDVTQIYNSRPQLVSTFNLTKNTLFREKNLQEFPSNFPFLLLKALAITKNKVITYLKLTRLCGTWPKEELDFIVNQMSMQNEILKLKKVLIAIQFSI